MRIDDIKLLYEYSKWANNRILEAAAKATAKQLHAPNELGWGSLQGALVHILDAEYSWRHYLADRAKAPWLKTEDFADLAAIRERYLLNLSDGEHGGWYAEDQAQWRYLENLSDDDLGGENFLRS